MHSELRSALKENNVAFELNLSEVLSQMLPTSYKDEYLGFAADLQHSEIILSMGSDCHKPHLKEMDYDTSEEIFRHYGINSSEFFCL